MDGFYIDKEMELYKTDKAEFYRRKNQLIYAELYTDLDAQMAIISALKKKWMEMKLRFKDMSNEEVLIMRKQVASTISHQKIL